MKAVRIANDETVISQARLDVLLAKERSHDAYLWAIRRMADKARAMAAVDDPRLTAVNTAFVIGYQRSLHDFSCLVMEAPSPD